MSDEREVGAVWVVGGLAVSGRTPPGTPLVPCSAGFVFGTVCAKAEVASTVAARPKISFIMAFSRGTKASSRAPERKVRSNDNKSS